MLGLPVERVRAFIRSGFVAPEKDENGRIALTFQDVVLLRTAKELVSQKISPRRVKAALAKLSAQLAPERPLTGVSITADGHEIVVRDGDEVWSPESGQVLFDFAIQEVADKVAPLAKKKARETRADGSERSAEEWFAHACELELASPADAIDAYRRAVAADPEHFEAQLNLGRMLHEQRDLRAAEACYRAALEVDPHSATAHFNLGVVLEDLRRPSEAVDAYRAAIAADMTARDAYYNLGLLYERQGKRSLALRYFNAYRRLSPGQ